MMMTHEPRKKSSAVGAVRFYILFFPKKGFFRRFLPSDLSFVEKILPAQCSENEIHDEEGSNEYQTDKIDPRPTIANWIVDLRSRGKRKKKHWN